MKSLYQPFHCDYLETWLAAPSLRVSAQNLTAAVACLCVGWDEAPAALGALHDPHTGCVVARSRAVQVLTDAASFEVGSAPSALEKNRLTSMTLAVTEVAEDLDVRQVEQKPNVACRPRVFDVVTDESFIGAAIGAGFAVDDLQAMPLPAVRVVPVDSSHRNASYATATDASTLSGAVATHADANLRRQRSEIVTAHFASSCSRFSRDVQFVAVSVAPDLPFSPACSRTEARRSRSGSKLCSALLTYRLHGSLVVYGLMVAKNTTESRGV